LQEKLLLEPYASQRDVAYIVVAPENDLVLNNVKLFFKEFSAVYEVKKLLVVGSFPLAKASLAYVSCSKNQEISCTSLPGNFHCKLRVHLFTRTSNSHLVS